MSKRSTKRRRRERNQRSASKTAVKLRERSKAAKLLAYQLRKENEEAAWQSYRRNIQVEKETHCSTCPMNLLCLAAHCPEDVMICVGCAAVFSLKLGIVVRCDGFNESLGLDRPWHSGQCPECYAYPEGRHPPLQVVTGFSVETPLVAAIARLQHQHFGGCSHACREES